ncbi:hypothetical protein [Bauldia litoralis]|uniref:Uncharacterized protein n=1 Tax=Bauldia litoralis TaxID=665467 RepID=A0A1G6EJC6_9HYPH|nr:hypothetical protein [Bauldia litoralis]SDB57537.1 hypothetical protein SAMN02982931_04577 [Bauldia litoralis]
MMPTISRTDILRFGGEAPFAQAVADFAAAIDAHRNTVDVPAPTADPLIEVVVRQYGGLYDVEPEPEPEPLPEPEPDPDPIPTTWRVSTYRIVRRLEEASLIDSADQALAASPMLFRRFYTAGSIQHDDPDAVAFLTAIGADPEVVLAPE